MAIIDMENKKSARRPRNILIDPEAIHKARIEALRAKKTIGEWLEETIQQRIERELNKG